LIAAKREGTAWTELLGSCRELRQNAPSTTCTTPQKEEANLALKIASKGPTETLACIVGPVTDGNAKLRGRPMPPGWAAVQAF